MKTTILILASAALLSGCGLFTTKPDQATAVRYKYIVNTIPEEMLKVPEQTYKLNVESATDKDAAKWMVESERRYSEIEKKLKAIKSLQDERIKNLKFPEEDLIKN